MNIALNFLDHFKDLKDPRSTKNRLHSMAEILLVTLCAAISNADGWQDVEDFGKAKIDFLKSILPFKNGIPSDDTYRRFFRALDPNVFQILFRNWIQSIQKRVPGNVIAIDGKSSRGSFDEDGKNMLHMISAYATEARLVLAQEKVDNKVNEITVIPQLIECLDLTEAIVTIDAMGCQFKIAEQIIAKGGDYVFALKGNQSGLRDDIALFLNDEDIQQMDTCIDYDKGHGRIEKRKCYVGHDVAWLKERHPLWKTIKSIIRIDSTRELKGKISTETRLYIGSFVGSAQKMLATIRSHWAIENSLHWILDMSFGEDQSRIRKGNAPQIMAIIRHVALNLLQLAKDSMKRMSIPRLRRMAGWDDQVLINILSQPIS